MANDVILALSWTNQSGIAKNLKLSISFIIEAEHCAICSFT